MRRSNLTLAALSLAHVLAACGDNGGDPDAMVTPTPDAARPDAMPPPVCGTPAATISTYPGTFAGATVGGGSNLTVAELACADERSWFEPIAEGQVINLTNLTPDARYVVELVTTEDLSFYVATMCDAAGPTAGACLLFVDESFTDERGDFVAPAGGAVALIIDAFDEPVAPATGMYTVNVREAECLNAFDCTMAATPVCDVATNTCVAGPDMCTGDDAAEPDDGPADATVLAAPTVGTPTVATAAVCSLPQFVEEDYYTVTVGAGGLRVSLAWTDTVGEDLDVYLLDSTGAVIAAGNNAGPGPEIILQDLPAGTYFIDVLQYDPADTAAATPYTLTLEVPDCLTTFQCLTAAAPVCDATGNCVGGFTDCTGDDANDNGAGGDDGPAAATALAGGLGAQVFNQSACATLGEGDWFRATMAVGQGLNISMTFDAAEDFDIIAFDSQGTVVGLAFWLNPETVSLTYLPAGEVYVQIVRFLPSGAAASAYTATFQRTAALTCVTSADCAAEYSNQIYRGLCAGGACSFIPAGAGANDAPCDSADDCTSGFCSYLLFESDAQDSVCSDTCTTSADCGAIGAGLACTTGFTTNFCLPTCTADLECGAPNPGATNDAGEPWDYLTCTTATGSCGP